MGSHSIHQFFARVHGLAQPGARGLLKPVLIQAAVATPAALNLLFAIDFLWPGVLLLPAIIVIWMTEAWSYYRMRRAT